MSVCLYARACVPNNAMFYTNEEVSLNRHSLGCVTSPSRQLGHLTGF